ncbi:MerR HTH family regulatory protein [Malonomonas rubra DSM 5091]|uniref:MerR HTH family regulatory protein n=1 Tax=Malonomonas rubra DSM 5091 TaxID=1122189 RepID=A0A1M6KRT4_MALRU|nr:chaperone modulator CbpM [Malonomonas rubra]SHJ61624.1 MerR HTH family regulatory protein [Malonomonas rubra DSM 5091]
MKKYPISPFYEDPEARFEYRIVARMTRVSEDFILLCEKEELVTAHTMLHGVKGLSAADISKLKLIRYLHEEMGLPLEAIDLVLRYRERVKTMERQLDEMEQRLRKKEQEHQTEVLTLCRRMTKLRGE